MSLTNTRLVLLLLLAALVALTVSIANGPGHVEAKNTVVVDNDNKVITITVNATLVGNPGKLEFVKTAFNAYWGKPGGYTYRCYDVVMKLDINTANSPQPGRHTIVIARTNPGDPWISRVNYPSADYRPASESTNSLWSDWDDAHKMAHEFGHILDLPDEYTYQDKNGNGKRDFDEPTIPDPAKAPEYKWTDKPPTNGKIDPGEVTRKPGTSPSLMAESADGASQILQRHINSLVNSHAPRGSIDCPVAARGTVFETPLKDDYRTLMRSAEWEADFDIDEDGIVTGEITLTYAALLTVEDLPQADVGIAGFDPEVGGTITDPNPTRTFPLTGKLEGDELTLEIATPEDAREPIEFTILADPGVSTGLVDSIGDDIVIEIDMTPFTPFIGPATVEDGVATFSEIEEDYQNEWTAEVEEPEGEPVG